MKKISILLLTTALSLSNLGMADTVKKKDISTEINQLNQQIQSQLKDMQAVFQKQVDALNSKTEKQMQDIQKSLEDQVKTLKKQTDKQLQELKTNLESQIRQINNN